jgi:hypothetical protein
MVPHALSGLIARLYSSVRQARWSGRTATLAAVTLLFAVAQVACDKVPLVAPAGTVITLISATNVLPINGSTDIIAVLIENGTVSTGTGGGGGAATTTTSAGTPVHNGTLVTFTTSLGKIEPFEARTNNGRVTVKLTADGRSGTARITAFSGGASAEPLNVLIGAAAVELVSLTTSASSVAAGGGTVTLTARVVDKDFNPLFGVPVAFTTTAGIVGAASGLTNESGLATTTLSTTVEASVTASAGSKTSTAAVIKVRSSSVIAVTVSTGSVPAGAPVSITVTPDPAVRFSSVILNFGDGDSVALGAISSATTRQHLYASAGQYPISVTGNDVDGGIAVASSSVVVSALNPTLSASPSSAAVGTPITFTVGLIPSTVSIERYEWEFGDGTITLTTTGPSVAHPYTTPGDKNVSVTVVPSAAVSRRTSTVVVITVPPSGGGH